MGHLFGIVSYMSNLDRYFDSVYPIFERDAVKFSVEDREAFGNWKPQGAAVMDE
jgi:hypothetical protein